MTRFLETDTLSNQNITSALEIGAYTADADRSIIVQFFADQVAGNGDYIFYATLQIGGAGSAYQYVPKTTATVASGVTAIAGQSVIINVRSGDVVKVYLIGLAGDTTTPDTIVRWFELAALQPITADRKVVVDANGLVDSNVVKVGPTGAGTAQTAGDVPGLITALPGDVDTQLSGVHGAGSWVSLGSGAVSWTHYVDDGANPLDGVLVEVSTDTSKANLVASGYTDALGDVTFLLDAGTYYFWKQRTNYTFTNPETVVVS